MFTEYGAVGNRVWQQQGHDSSRRVHFRYYPSGQLRAVQAPGTSAGFAADSLAYDTRGNLALTVSPAGFHTRFIRDRLGRDSVVIPPRTARRRARPAGWTLRVCGGSGNRERRWCDGGTLLSK